MSTGGTQRRRCDCPPGGAPEPVEVAWMVFYAAAFPAVILTVLVLLGIDLEAGTIALGAVLSPVVYGLMWWAFSGRVAHTLGLCRTPPKPPTWTATL